MVLEVRRVSGLDRRFVGLAGLRVRRRRREGVGLRCGREGLVCGCIGGLCTFGLGAGEERVNQLGL